MNRNRYDIMADMLRVISKGFRLTTHIMYRSNLSSTYVRMYLELLVKNGYLIHENGYVITDKGQRFLRAYEKFMSVIRSP